MTYYTEKTFVSADGSKINYVDEGKDKKQTYLFVHGWSTQGDNFAMVGKELLNTHRIVWLDQRGHGKTRSDRTFTLEQLAADIKALIEYLELKEITFVGYSMGALVLFQYIRDYGSIHLKKAAILDISPKLLNNSEWKYGLYQGHYMAEHYEKDRLTQRTNFLDFGGFFFYQVVEHHKPEEVRDYKPKLLYKTLTRNLIKPDRFQGLTELWDQMMIHDYREDLKNIEIPLAIIYSRPGSIYEEGTAKYIESQVPNGILYPVDDCGHTFLSTKGDKILEILQEFY